MTNGEWLDYLAHNAPDELSAWFDAERITNQAEMLHMPESPTSATMQQIWQVIEDTAKCGVYGDTEPENENSREQLEADIRELMRNLYEIGYTDAKLNYGILGKETRPRLFTFDEKRGAKFIELLDRQAAITAEETSNAWEEYRDATQREIAELTAELEKATDNLNSANKDFENARAELTAERDKLEEMNEYNVLQYELASEDCDRLQAQVDGLKAERVKLRSQICKLEDDLVGTSDERDNWKANCEDWKKHARAAENACYETMLEREDYRKKFGKCLDYADAIHALMDDEGMA